MKSRWSRREFLKTTTAQAALNFAPMSENDKQRLHEKVSPSRAAWQRFLQSHDDSVAV
ncbi:MAG TPA: hypothetical protein VI585_00225 [Candidatus Binatia bacterium]